MADRLKNIAGLFKDGRTRIIVITTLVTLVIAIVIGVMSFRGRVSGDDASAGVSQAPGNIQSVPFDAPNAEYARLQEQQNQQQATQAEQSGSSAIPTIIRATNDSANAPAPVGDVGVGFTALSREQSDAGTFNPKVFDQGGKQKTCAFISGTPVYDKDGKLIGYAGPDGNVRDANGNIIGRVGPDGSVIDCDGKVIGKVSTAAATTSGTPVYDDNGRLIGYVGPDGKVRDLNGKEIGTLGPDGTLRDANGKILGRVGGALSGTPVYDDNGNLIGYVGADGKVRDASGRVIGTVGPDGKVRDASGKVLGTTGVPVYDANGNLIGFAGPDGKVRDANGNVIGTVGPDGTVRDLKGNIIGKANEIAPGTPIYDSNGNVIGYVGPDGKVRDANGNVIGTVGVDGVVKDANGNIIGSINKPNSANANTASVSNSSTAGTPIYDANGNIIGQSNGAAGQQGMTANDYAAAAMARQQEILKNQNLQQQVQQKQQAMMTQANQLLVAWSSPVQQFVAGTDQQANAGSSNGGQNANGTSANGSQSNAPVFVKAGTVLYGVINTAINSDQPGPIMATVVTGNFKGAKLLGSLSNQGQAVMLTFNTLTMDSLPKSISINAVAIDQDTARTALSTYTDNHYLLRYGSVFAAAFLQGYGQAFQTAGSSTSTTGLTTTTTAPDLSGSGKFYAALGTVGQQFSSQLNSVMSTPPTVYVASGTAVGVLFLADVTSPAS